MTVEPLILAVDDEAGILRLIKLELSSQGFRVVVAGDGEEALRLAEQQRPDIVVLDIMMPQMSGLEVMRRLRERTSVPVILLTAKDHDDDKVRGLELGADDYLVKPFNPEELSARVRAVLRRGYRPVTGGENVVSVGNVDIDLDRRLVKKDGDVVSLTRTEARSGAPNTAMTCNTCGFGSRVCAASWSPIRPIQPLSRRCRGSVIC